jgi:hypothetical protein
MHISLLVYHTIQQRLQRGGLCRHSGYDMLPVDAYVQAHNRCLAASTAAARTFQDVLDL